MMKIDCSRSNLGRKGRIWALGLLLLALLPATVRAESAAREALDAAPLDGLYEFAEAQRADIDPDDVLETVLNGETLSLEGLLDIPREIARELLREGMDAAAALLLPCLLLAVMGCILSGEAQSSGGACFLILLTLLAGIARMLSGVLAEAESCLRAAVAFSDAAAPALSALMTAAGLSGASALMSPAAALIGNLVENLFLKIGIPACRLAAAVLLAGGLCKTIDLGRLFDLIWRAAGWMAGLAITLFTALIALESSTAASLDNVAVRTAKFAVDSVTPVIGSGVSDAWDSYVSGILIAKDAVGVSGVAVLLSVALRPLLSGACSLLILSGISALTGIAGDRRASRAAEQAAAVCRMALTLEAGATVIWVIMIGAAMSAGKSILG